MPDKLTTYRRAAAPVPEKNRLWPLYGAGFENLGRDGQPIEVPMLGYGPDELLVRHDACGLCFSDIKVIRAGQSHPRIYRDMQAEPVVLGHEVALTVVGVGENLRGQYRMGDRFIVQADIFVDGVGYAYGYEIQGGLAQYNVLDRRVLDGDHGNYLIPVQPETGYAESALTEPWACVVAAYGLTYRTGLKPGGTAWIIGAGGEKPYTISAGFDETSHPARLLLTNIPADFADWLKTRAAALGVEVIEVADIAAPPVEQVDDIVLLGADPDVVKVVSPRLAEPVERARRSDRHLGRWCPGRRDTLPQPARSHPPAAPAPRRELHRSQGRAGPAPGLPPTRPRVTLCGSGGIGKTALAAEAVWILAPGNEPPPAWPWMLCVVTPGGWSM